MYACEKVGGASDMGHFYLTTTLRLTTGDRFAGCDTSNNSLFNRKLKQKLRRLFSSAFRDSLCADSGWGTTNSKLFKKQKTESEASAAVFSRFTEINFAQILVVTRQTVDYLTENRNRSLNGCFFRLTGTCFEQVLVVEFWTYKNSENWIFSSVKWRFLPLVKQKSFCFELQSKSAQLVLISFKQYLEYVKLCEMS